MFLFHISKAKTHRMRIISVSRVIVRYQFNVGLVKWIQFGGCSLFPFIIEITHSFLQRIDLSKQTQKIVFIVCKEQLIISPRKYIFLLLLITSKEGKNIFELEDIHKNKLKNIPCRSLIIKEALRLFVESFRWKKEEDSFRIF